MPDTDGRKGDKTLRHHSRSALADDRATLGEPGTPWMLIRAAARLPQRLIRWLHRKRLEARLWCHESEMETETLAAMRHRYLEHGGSVKRWSRLTRERVSQIY